MADTITTKKVTDLTENSAPTDEDLILVGNAGTAVLRKIKWSNILAAIKTKIASWAFDTLTTTDKTLPGAINELNSKFALEYIANINFNDARNGFFVFDSGNIQNGPDGIINGFLIQFQTPIAGSLMIIQIVIPGSATGINIRTCWYDSWKNWTEM